MSESDSDSGSGSGGGDAGGTRLDLDFGEDGLVPVVAQDADTGAVLMLAYASPEAVARTRRTGLAHYHSRSRGELWQKGATSGHVQHVHEIRVDCDADALLYRVDQEGGACHTGFDSCFHRIVEDVDDGTSVAVTEAEDAERAFDPDAVYG
jgi:phosphoribosyl-AMP cyclohydrolase